jgi:allophanate hydrolase
VSWNGSPALPVLGRLYREGRLRPSEVVEAVHARIAGRGGNNVWIHLVRRADALARARALEAEGPGPSPLWGAPFSVKDCNDVPGLPTTNALPAMRYVATATGPPVERLLAAGAVCLGKTNMDQLGIGLVGVRTPYGVARNPFSAAHVPGGSSSGSAVSVSAGLASFSLANDAAGSGRVPCGFTNTVGVKPTPGLVSNRCVSGGGCLKTLETVSVMALTVEDGMEALRAVAGFDGEDPFSRPEADGVGLGLGDAPERFRFGVPTGEGPRFFGDGEAARVFADAVARLEPLGGEPVPADWSPFEEAQRLLYEGPFVAERTPSLAPVLERRREDLHPVTRTILEGGRSWSAMDLFRAVHRVAELKRDARALWRQVGVLLVPTAPTIPTIAEVEADPVGLNARLGTYTNFVNLIGPVRGRGPGGLPRGRAALGRDIPGAFVAGGGGRHDRPRVPPCPGRPARGDGDRVRRGGVTAPSRAG